MCVLGEIVLALTKREPDLPLAWERFYSQSAENKLSLFDLSLTICIDLIFCSYATCHSFLLSNRAIFFLLRKHVQMP